MFTGGSLGALKGLTLDALISAAMMKTFITYIIGGVMALLIAVPWSHAHTRLGIVIPAEWDTDSCDRLFSSTISSHVNRGRDADACK